VGKPAKNEFDPQAFLAKVGAGKTIVKIKRNQHVFKQGDVAGTVFYAYLLPPLSFGGALLARPWPRFHTPLIEPDRQISRIRLVWGFLCQGGITPTILLFDPRREHSSVPTAYFHRRRGAAAVKDGASSAPPKACP
jgi:hypothetical protein